MASAAPWPRRLAPAPTGRHRLSHRANVQNAPDALSPSQVGYHRGTAPNGGALGQGRRCRSVTECDRSLVSLPEDTGSSLPIRSGCNCAVRAFTALRLRPCAHTGSRERRVMSHPGRSDNELVRIRAARVAELAATYEPIAGRAKVRCPCSLNGMQMSSAPICCAFPGGPRKVEQRRRGHHRVGARNACSARAVNQVM